MTIDIISTLKKSLSDQRERLAIVRRRYMLAKINLGVANSNNMKRLKKVALRDLNHYRHALRREIDNTQIELNLYRRVKSVSQHGWSA